MDPIENGGYSIARFVYWRVVLFVSSTVASCFVLNHFCSSMALEDWLFGLGYTP